jgi:hypothetical protein
VALAAQGSGIIKSQGVAVGQMQDFHISVVVTDPTGLVAQAELVVVLHLSRVAAKTI